VIVESGIHNKQAKTARMGTIIWKLERPRWAEQAINPLPVPDISAYKKP
jgi:hypothetical protein